MKNASSHRAHRQAPHEPHNAIDVLLGPTLRDEMQIIDRFVFRLRAWEPRLPLAFTALPDRPEGGLRILNTGPAWSDEEVTLLEKRIAGLARELRVETSTRRRSIPDASQRPVWDVTWVDEQLRALDQDAAQAKVRIEQRLAELALWRSQVCARISAELSLFKYCWLDDNGEDYVVALADSAAVRALEYARREIPDFHGDPAAHQALVQSLVGSGLGLTASASMEGDLNMLTWRCTLADLRPRAGGLGVRCTGEGLDLPSALCAACIAYLDSL